MIELTHTYDISKHHKEVWNKSWTIGWFYGGTIQDVVKVFEEFLPLADELEYVDECHRYKIEKEFEDYN